MIGTLRKFLQWSGLVPVILVIFAKRVKYLEGLGGFGNIFRKLTWKSCI